MDPPPVSLDSKLAGEVDYVSHEQLTELQVSRLQRTLQRAYDQVELARTRMTDVSMSIPGASNRQTSDLCLLLADFRGSLPPLES